MVYRTCLYLPILLASCVSASRAGVTAGDNRPPAIADGSWSSDHAGTLVEDSTRRALLRVDFGRADLSVTTSDARARQFVQQGVALLIGLANGEADRSFREAAALDNHCAIAFWGLAMASLPNEPRARGFINAAVRLKDSRPVGSQEGMYIDALDAYLKAGPANDRSRRDAYVRALERILARYPGDAEARVFLARQLGSNRRAGLPTGSIMAADALLQLVIAAKPTHPCHLDRLLLWEDEDPALALDSAARCGPCAPGVAPMWHTPGHVYERLGRVDDAVWHYEAAVRVENAGLARSGMIPGRDHRYAAESICLARALAKVGRARDAVSLARWMTELPRRPRDLATVDPGGCLTRGRELSLDLLSRFELWDELAALAERTDLGPADDAVWQVRRRRALGRASFAKGDEKGGERELAAIESLAYVHATAKTSAAAGGNAPSRTPSLTCELAAATDELKGRAAVAAGDVRGGLRLLERAGDIDPLELARVRALAGQPDEAENALMGQAERRPNEVLPLAHLIDFRWRNGRRAEAEQTFHELREAATQADLEIPALASLAPIARALGYPDDWRLRRPRSSDTEPRPPLDSLGPLRWEPRTAPAWALRDAEGGEHPLGRYRGKPVVVIFYLGAGCLHCVQQLEDFAPMTRNFKDAGISLVGISTDDEKALQKSLEKYGDEPFPFPLLSDANLYAFRSYFAFDEFTNHPLHGTFLIGPDGLIRWQDIGHEPFSDPKFLLEEANRLLGRGPVSPGIEEFR